jgi:hypothetical protein
MVFLLGLLPLLLLTFSGVLIFAAKQSLTLAATNGARAALHFGDPDSRATSACKAAKESMNWLFSLADNSAAACSLGVAGSNKTALVQVNQKNCTVPEASSTSSSSCLITVTTSYDYEDHPMIIGTGSLYSWMNSVSTIQSSATIRIYEPYGTNPDAADGGTTSGDTGSN